MCSNVLTVSSLQLVPAAPPLEERGSDAPPPLTLTGWVPVIYSRLTGWKAPLPCFFFCLMVDLQTAGSGAGGKRQKTEPAGRGRGAGGRGRGRGK